MDVSDSVQFLRMSPCTRRLKEKERGLWYSKWCHCWKYLTRHWASSAAKAMVLWFMSQDDWYHHHYTPSFDETAILEMCLPPDMLKVFSNLTPPMRKHWQDDDNFLKAETRISVPSPLSSHRERFENFEDFQRNSRGAAEKVSVFRKAWISCIIPSALSPLL